MSIKIIDWLRLPAAEKIKDIDDFSTSEMHSAIIQQKTFLKRIYTEFYKEFKKVGNEFPGGLLVELGSGGGFIKTVIPNVVTSDIISSSIVDMQFSALNMPFGDETVDAFFMLDVLHHLDDVFTFFKGLDRCLKVGGKTVMIEPANSFWSRFVYKNFHHEPFDPSVGWSLKETGRLSSANGAIAWIVFFRDRMWFQKEFPRLKIIKLKSHTPFRYLVSGGVSMRQLLPSFTYDIIRGIEILLSPFNRYIGMFLTIEIMKVS